MITSIIIGIVVVLIIAYFIGAAQDNGSQRKRLSSGEISATGKNAFEVVRIDNPTLQLPEENSVSDIEIPSFSDDKITYHVSISKMTCSCPDFQKHRKNVAPNDPRRVCKHIATVLEENNFFQPQSELALVILQRSSTNKKLTTVKLESGNEVAICHGGSEWIDVFTRKRKKGDNGGLYTGKYDRFGFNLNENRWSYGDGPPGAREIRFIISQVV